MAQRDFRAGKRYATALFGAAQSANTLDVVERDLGSITDLMKSTPALLQVWDSPLIPAERKKELVGRVLGESLNPLTLKFLDLLIDKRREEILDAVQEEFRRLSDAANRLMRAEATFAVEPTEAERAGLIRSLAGRTGQTVELGVHVDPSILGGVVVRMRDTIIDGSVRGTLERLREQMLHEA